MLKVGKQNLGPQGTSKQISSHLTYMISSKVRFQLLLKYNNIHLDGSEALTINNKHPIKTLLAKMRTKTINEKGILSNLLD